MQASDSMPEWLRRRAELTPDRTALIDAQDRRFTWGQLDAAASDWACRMRRAGIAPGDRVALMAENGAPFVHAVFALGRLGATVLPINTRLADDEIAYQLRTANAAAVLADGAFNDRARAFEGFAAVDIGSWLDETGVAHETESTAHHQASGAETSIARSVLSNPQGILFTSGTTGRPKGAIITYGNHWWSAVGSALNLGLSENDRWLACLPLFHIGGLAILMRSVIYGITAVVHARFDPDRANRAIDRGGVTIVSVVAQMLERMLDARRNAPFPPTLRCILIGGAPVPEPLLERCARIAAPLVQTYGLTETASQVATLSTQDAERKPGSAGKPLFPVDLKVDAPPGVVGDIWVRGPNVSPGYITDRGLELRNDPWFKTGDLGRLDEEGYLYIAARRSDLIISGGENVYPAEVEAVLQSHPAVLEAGVTGRPDERWGEAPVAFIVTRPGLTIDPAELEAFCRQRLAKYKTPVAFHILAELPRNASGKLLRDRLKASPTE